MNSKLMASWCENAKVWFALISAISGSIGYLISTHSASFVKSEMTYTMTAQNDADIKELKKGSIDIKTILIEHSEQMKSIPKIERQLEKIVDRMDALARIDERKRTVAAVDESLFKQRSTERKQNGM